MRIHLLSSCLLLTVTLSVGAGSSVADLSAAFKKSGKSHYRVETYRALSEILNVKQPLPTREELIEIFGEPERKNGGTALIYNLGQEGGVSYMGIIIFSGDEVRFTIEQKT